MSYNTDLQSNNNGLRDILAAVNDLPDAGSPSEGVELPTLTNPGDGEKLLEGYELIGQDGEVVAGAMKNNGSTSATLDLDNLSTVVPEGYTPGGTIKIDPEIPAEIDVHTDLIAQIAAALEGKVAGGGGGDSGLPDGYVRCSYIRFEKAQYIDTGIVPTQDTKIKVLFTRELSTSHYMFGVASSDNTAAVTAYVGGSWRFGNRSVTKTINTNPDLVQCAVVDAGGITMPNNTNTFTAPANFTAVGSLLLGVCRNASGTVPSTPTYTGNISLFEMWSGNTLVRKLIPVVKDGTYRFFDEVSGEFFDSKTTTPLSGGNW